MYCHRCGKQLPDGSRFCHFCGAQLTEAAPPAAGSEPIPQDEPLWESDPYAQPPARRKSRAGLVVGLIAGVLVLVVVLGVLFVLPRFRGPEGFGRGEDFAENPDVSLDEEPFQAEPVPETPAATMEPISIVGESYESLLARFGVQHVSTLPPGVEPGPGGGIETLAELVYNSIYSDAQPLLVVNDYVYEGDAIVAFTETQYLDVTIWENAALQDVGLVADNTLTNWGSHPGCTGSWEFRRIGDGDFLAVTLRAAGLQQMSIAALSDIGFTSLSMSTNEKEDTERGALLKPLSCEQILSILNADGVSLPEADFEDMETARFLLYDREDEIIQCVEIGHEGEQLLALNVTVYINYYRLYEHLADTFSWEDYWEPILKPSLIRMGESNNADVAELTHAEADYRIEEEPPYFIGYKRFRGLDDPENLKQTWDDINNFTEAVEAYKAEGFVLQEG